MTDFDLDELLEEDSWHALTFEEARPNLEQFMLTYLSIFPLEKGRRPQTDGKTIYLPSKQNDFKDGKDDLYQNRNMSLYLHSGLHEILHIREGSFLVDARPFLEKFNNKGLAHAVFNIMEDSRIEHNARKYVKPADYKLLAEGNNYLAVKREFPEAVQDRALEMFLYRLIVKDDPSTFKPELAAAEKETLDEEVEHPDLKKQGLKTVGDVLDKMISMSSDIYDEPVEAVWQIMPEVYDLLTKTFPNIEQDFPTEGTPFAPVEAPSSDKGEGQEGQGGETAQNGSGGQKGKVQKAYVGFGGDVHDFSNAEKKATSAEDLVGTYQSKKEREKEEAEIRKKIKSGVGPGGRKKGGFEESEVQIITYDDIKKSYTIVKRLQKKRYKERNPRFISQLNAYSHLRRTIVEHFEMLQPNELQRSPYSENPDELNIESVVEVLCDPALRAGARIYDSYFVNERDSTTAILMDISGSTDSRLESGKRVIDVEKEAAGLIYQALTEVEDNVLMYAFSTDFYGDKVTYLYPLTGLDNLGALSPENANADGVAIRGVTNELNKIDAKEKTLIVLSDGKPVGTGKSKDGPVIDTAMAFMEAEAQGIRTVYFNVDNEASDYFPLLTRNVTYAVSISKVEQLPHAVGEFVLEHG